MCKKQTSVSHSSTETEIISLDAGLRLDGIPALDLLDLTVSVLGNTTQNRDRTVRLVKEQTWSLFSTSHDSQTQAISESYQWFGIMFDFIPSNVQSSHQEALLYVFEDKRSSDQDDHKGKEARHWDMFSRTHRGALDSLFDRINLDSKIQIKYIDTKKPTRRHLNQREMSHVMNWIIFCVCLTLAISVLQIVHGVRCSERTPVVLPSTASDSRGENQTRKSISSELANSEVR